jgi:hypothetical protein
MLYLGFIILKPKVMKQMKKMLLVLLMVAPLAFVSCDKEDDKDPILGEWVYDLKVTINEVTTTNYNTWIFEEDNTGTYDESVNGDPTYNTTFTWSKDGDAYMVDFADEEKEDISVSIDEILGTTILVDGNDTLLAEKK